MTVMMVQAGMLCVFVAPLYEVGVLYPYRETLFPDVDGLQHPSMSQLGRHIVYVKDPRKLNRGEVQYMVIHC